MSRTLAAIAGASLALTALTSPSAAQPGALTGDAHVAIVACLNAAIDRQRITRAGRVLKLTCDGSPSQVLFDRLDGLVETITVEWGEVRPFSRIPGLTSNNCARVIRTLDGGLADYTYCEIHINVGELNQS